MEIVSYHPGDELLFPADDLEFIPIGQEIISKTQIAEVWTEQDCISPGQTEPALLLSSQR